VTRRALPALAAACAAAGPLVVLATGNRTGVPAVTAGAVTAAAVNARPALSPLAAAVEAVSRLLTAVIRARADAKATVIHAKTRAELARAGLGPGMAPRAAAMQRALSANPDLSGNRRPTDETILRLHGAEPSPHRTAGRRLPATRAACRQHEQAARRHQADHAAGTAPPPANRHRSTRHRTPRGAASDAGACQQAKR
jgi:hypothetical protein